MQVVLTNELNSKDSVRLLHMEYSEEHIENSFFLHAKSLSALVHYFWLKGFSGIGKQIGVNRVSKVS